MKPTIALIALAALTSPALCHAGGPAFSGMFASAENAETVYNNPAGMARLDGSQITGQGIAIYSFGEFEVDEDLTTVDGGNPDDSAPSLIPAVYYSQQLGDDWHAGVSVNIPSGFGSMNGDDWSGRYYSNEFTLVYVAFSPAVAYSISDSFSVGAGVSAVYTSSTTKTQVNNDPFLPGAPDGKLEAESDGWGFGFSLSALYEFSENTRVGLAWRSESDADMDTSLDFKGAVRPPGVVDSLEGQNIKVSSVMPMIIGAGLFHEFENEWQMTADIMWMQFSEFGVTEIQMTADDIDVPDSNFNDFFAFSTGVSWPINPKMRMSVGAVYVEQPIEDEDRSFGIQLDEMWGVGAGIAYQLDNGNDYEMNLNVINTGEAPIDTGDDPINGRVVGETENHYAMTLDFSYNWR